MEDLFDTPFFKKSKLFVSIVGQWPFQSRRMRNSIRAIYHVVIWAAVPSMVRAFYLYWLKGKLEAVVLCFPGLFTLFGVSIKYNHYTVKQLETKLLFEQVRSDWTLISAMGDPESRSVLEKYTDIGRATVKFYSTYIYLSLACFLSAPNIPRVLNWINPLNESRETPLLFPMDYGEKGNKYRDLIMLHSCIGTALVINIFVACESIYFPLVCHCCAMFAVVSFPAFKGKIVHFATIESMQYSSVLWEELGYVIGTVLVSNRLERASTPEVLKSIRKVENTFESYDKNMVCLRQHDAEDAVIASCVKLHSRAIWYADYLNTYYSNTYFVLVTMNMILISVTGLQLALQIGILEELVAAGTYFLAQLLHLFFLSLPGQFLMDCSETVSESAYNFPWFNLRSNTQKLLVLIIIRGMKPSLITAGSFFILKMETFSSVVQTSMSYLTVLSSFY